MIKYYKINQGTTNAALKDISNSILTGFKTDSMIVAEDTNRIYYHSPATGSKPVLIGNTDNYVGINFASTQQYNLQPNTNYYKTGTGRLLKLPDSDYCNLKVGDVVRVFNKGDNTVDLIFRYGKSSTTDFVVPKDASYNREFVFRYQGNDVWAPLTGVIAFNELPSAQISYNSTTGWDTTNSTQNDTWGVTVLTSVVDANAANTTAKVNRLKSLSATSFALPGSTIFYFTSAIIQEQIKDVYFNTTVPTSNLPSANTSGGWGITTIESGYTKDISGSAKPIAASAVYKYISGNVESYTTGAISGIKVGDATATITNRVADLGTIVQSSYTKAGISGSAKPMAASAVYNYVSANVDSYTTGAVSAINYNGTKYTPTNRVADLGTLSTQINGAAYGANTGNLIDLGNGWVNVTSPNAGEYVKRTSNGYITDPGVATLSSVYSSTAVSNNILTVDGKAIPVMIKTNAGTLYPIEKGTLSAATVGGVAKYKIDINPYLVYDGAASFAGSWTVYYGAGINDIYTTANTIQTVGVDASVTQATINFNNGDVAIVNCTGSTSTPVNLLITNVPIGHGMIIKVINNAGRPITFATRTIISSPGSYSFSIFNFGNNPEQVGEVTVVYAPQSTNS